MWDKLGGGEEDRIWGKLGGGEGEEDGIWGKLGGLKRELELGGVKS